MAQIKIGHKSPVRVVLGPNCRPPNSSHFRNLKCLKIAKVVSQKNFKQRKEKEKKRKIMKEIGKEGKGGKKGWWKETRTTQEIC